MVPDAIRIEIGKIYPELIQFSGRINAGKSHSADVVHDVIQCVLSMKIGHVIPIIERGKLKPYLMRSVWLLSFDKSRNRYKSQEAIEVITERLQEMHTSAQPEINELGNLDWFDRTIAKLYASGYNMREIEELTGITKRHLEKSLNRTKMQLSSNGS